MRLLPLLLLVLACDGASPARPGRSSSTSNASPLDWATPDPSIARVETRANVPLGTTGSCWLHPASRVLAVEPGTTLVRVAPDVSSAVYQRDADATHAHVLHHFPTGTRTTLTSGRLLGYTAAGTAVFVETDPAPGNETVVRRVLEVDPPTGRLRSLLPRGAIHVGLFDDGRILLMSGRTLDTWVYFPETTQLEHAASLAVQIWIDERPDVHLPVVGSDHGSVLVDAAAHALVPLPNLWWARVVDDRLLWVDGARHGWIRAPGKPSFRLDPAMRDFRPEVQDEQAGQVLVIDGGKRGWWWDVPRDAVTFLGEDVESGKLTRDGRSAALVRAQDGRHVLVLRDLATGAEREVLRSEHDLEPRTGDDGRLVAALESWDEPLAGRRVLVRLFDVAGGREVPLAGLQPGSDDGVPSVTAGFHRGGRLLYVCDGSAEHVFDTATGADLFTTKRAVVVGDGTYSGWGPGDDRFYLREHAHESPTSDLYVWDAATGAESLVAAGSQTFCQDLDHDVYGDLFPTDGRVEPFRLTSWNHRTDRRTVLSTASVWDPTCLDRGVLFRDGADLAFADLPGEAVRPVGKAIRQDVVVGGHVVFNDDASICEVPVGRL